MQLVALGIATIILAPVAEEILFRGVLYPTIKQHGFPRAALWGTSVLFALIHFNVAIFVPLLLLALLLVWLYEKTDNLLAPIAAHATFNAVNFAMFFLMKDVAPKIPAQP
jgi:membrane protease YdiL (CAAX protease family)